MRGADEAAEAFVDEVALLPAHAAIRSPALRDESLLAALERCGAVLSAVPCFGPKNTMVRLSKAAINDVQALTSRHFRSPR